MIREEKKIGYGLKMCTSKYNKPTHSQSVASLTIEPTYLASEGQSHRAQLGSDWGNHRALVTQQKLNHGGARGCRSNLMQGRSIVVVIYV